MTEPRPATLSRLLLALILLSVTLLGLPQPAHADWVYRGDTIPAGEIVENDVIIYGTDVAVLGTVHGDVVAVGSTVTVDGTVQGSLLAVGRTVAINGEVGGSVYVGGTTLRLGPSSWVANNVHFGGLLLDSQRGSRIGRDLVAAAVRATIGSEIGRGLNAVIAFMTFNGKIGYGLEEPPAEPESDAAPVGTWRRPTPAQGDASSFVLYVGSGGHKLAGYAAPARATLFPVENLRRQEEEQGPAVPEWLVARVGEFLALLLLGGLAVWLIPARLERPVERLRRSPLPAIGYGLLAAIIFVNGIGIAILLAVMLVAAGIWLGSITLWTLAFLFWGIGFSLLVLSISLFALAVFYGSKVIVSYLVGKLLLDRLAPKAARYGIVVLLLGLILYVLLRSIPTIGWIIEVIVVVLGLGAIWLAFRHRAEPAEAGHPPAGDAEPDEGSHPGPEAVKPAEAA